MSNSVISLLEKTIDARASFFDARHETAFRLFNGFIEGYPELVVELYGSTLVIHNYAKIPAFGQRAVQQGQEFLRDRMAWLRAGIVKTRYAETQKERRGKLSFGEQPDTKIQEHGVWYSIDLSMNRDTSFYLDTRNLRKWLIENMENKTFLNTFAYTGSLGVAAMAGGASRVVQHDVQRRFLNVAKTSYTLNGFPIQEADFITVNFFSLVAKLKPTNQLFDCVLLDAPFFSTTSKGRVDQINESARLINKVRPLVRDEGYLVAVNNALYVSGREHMQTLEALCRDEYLKVKDLIPVPEDFTGFPETRAGSPIADPTPFNHSTKIAILQVRRKRTT